MDKGLILCVLLVTLSWKFLGTYAMTNTTNNATSSSNTSATATSNMTNHGNASATPTGNMTETGNMTNHSNMTTMPPGNMTTMTGNMTNPGNTSTTPTGNMNNTQAENTTVSTQAPPLVTNTSVAPLQENLVNTDCGKTQLCAAEPASCDPGNGRCFFLGARRQSGNNFNFDLSGESAGYIAATLSGGGPEGDPTYVCANSRSSVRFFTTRRVNGILKVSNLSVNSVRGKVEGNRIQCRFLATVPVTSRRARATGISLSVSTGEFNDTDNSLGAPTDIIRTSPVDLGNPNATVTNEITANTTSTVNIPGLQGTITRNDCGSAKLCADRPTDCDPSTGDNCFFLSAKERSSQTFDFELSGQSDGYIAAGLSTAESQAGSHRAYICANNNGSVRFFTATIDNFELNTTVSLDSSNERGSFASGKIQCTFTAELPDTSARAEATYSLSVSTGSFNASSLAFGRATFAILTSRVNLSDPSANITNLLTTNTTNASAHPVTATLSFLPALMVTICMLAFTAM
ncbi:uncharacterized protein LOC119793230 isoform X2 [Cyprinodon tularosa]|uniref:uncharacterized protein LOC119793230 isoform X2 n=1 Tax=Cyprinodon tularosa TaxID=77115 RepID=UPI0018E1E29A|nr:uncharacterized protein LOC119793230 isoform X2 [Cyprinodon tularosa]